MERELIIKENSFRQDVTSKRIHDQPAFLDDDEKSAEPPFNPFLAQYEREGSENALASVLLDTKQPPPLPSRPVDLAPFTYQQSTALTNDYLVSAPSPNNKQDSTSTVVESSNLQLPERSSGSPAENYSHQDITPSVSSPSQDVTTADIHTARRKWIGRWQLGRTIGEGSSGKVKLAHHADTKETCVVKAVRRPKLANGMTANNRDANYSTPETLEKIYKRELYMIREACLGMMLQHENIVKLHSAVLGENHFYCFFELVDGEDLVDFISREGPLGEGRSRDIFRKVVSAIEYAHRNHVVHRDIKLENIRYHGKTGVVKILDFGFASFYSTETMLKTNCGSPCYAAPEIYDNKAYDGPMIDVWSLGVCLFGMVTGTLPFDGPDFKTLATKVRAGKVIYPSELSNDLVALLSGMFRTDPRKRATLTLVIHHPWVNAGCKLLPLDYIESFKSSDPIIQLDWVKDVTNASVCQAGIMLMEALERRIPNQKLEEELPVDGQAESTDEDDSIDDPEVEASKFVSNMTIKDKKRSNIWWRRLFWGAISKHFGKREREEKEARLLEKLQQQLKKDEEMEVERTGGTIAQFVDKIRARVGKTPANDAQITYDQLANNSNSAPETRKARFRAWSINVVNLLTPEKSTKIVNPIRHARWSPFKPR